MSKKSQTIETYNKSAKSLAAKFDDLGARIDDIEKGFSFDKKDNPNVLEIGCGNGRDAKEIIKHIKNGSYLGIDVSENLIKIASLNVPNANFEVADIEEYSFPKNTDIIFAFASLIHSDSENLGKILDKAHQALNKEGIFYISLKYGKYQELTREDEFGTRTYYFYNEEIVKKLVDNKYKILYSEKHELRVQKWIEIVLRKI